MARQPANSRRLPDRPSAEYLRKEAKRLAKADRINLAAAQRRLAIDYGKANWAELMRHVASLQTEASLAPLAAAARAGDLAEVSRLIATGHTVDGDGRGTGTPLFHACCGRGTPADRIGIVEALLAAGANPRRDDGGSTALHAAAAKGPLALVEALIRGGALEWQPDSKGKSALDHARAGSAPDRDAIAELLDRPVIRDPSFRAAVSALQTGASNELARLIDAEPRLLHERILEPACYREAGRSQYFRDPKLFWFIANNPTLMTAMPPNIGEIATIMIERGVGKSDLDYTLELLMTSSPARDQGLQDPLIHILLRAGATPTAQGIEVTLGHRELAPVQALLDAGLPMTPAIAAAFGDVVRLRALLLAATAADVQTALGMAVINGHIDAARATLDAGADPNEFLPVHAHSLPMHQAALDENVPLMELLVAHGARTDVADKLWSSTPLGWARHQGKGKSQAYLEGLVRGGTLSE